MTQSSRYANTTARPEVLGGLSAASVASYFRSVRRLFNFLFDEGKIKVNPAKKLEGPKVARGLPKAVEREDFEKLLKATDGDDVVSIRDRAVILLLADTGCRVGGFIKLRIKHVDLKQQIMKLTEKGDKTRLVPFTVETAAALQTWLAVRPDRGDEYLWTTLGLNGGTHLTASGVTQLLRRLKRDAGVTGPCNPHAFRHMFAREFLLNGGGIEKLADLMGHSDVSVTWRHYGIFLINELQVEHEKYSPVGRLGREGKL